VMGMDGDGDGADHDHDHDDHDDDKPTEMVEITTLYQMITTMVTRFLIITSADDFCYLARHLSSGVGPRPHRRVRDDEDTDDCGRDDTFPCSWS
jgi:hypothetical protein